MIPRTLFDVEHEQLRDSFRKFLEAEVVPNYTQWEKDGQVDRELWRKAGEQGFLVTSMPEKYGGLAADYRPGIVIAEECAKLGFGSLTFPAHSDIIVPYIIHHGTDTQKQKYLPGCLSGDIVTAIAMTEPGTGSDLQGVKTSAVLDNDEYIINGSKTFISNGQLADIVIVVCKTGKEIKGGSGISLIIVEADTPGFEKGRNLEKIGMKAQDTSELFFNDVRVPKGNLLGHEGMGFKYLMQELPQERISIAIEAIAVAEEIFARTVEYVKERHAFGSPIAAFQNTQFKLAEMDAEITSIRVFVDRCLELHLDKKLDSVTAAKAKLLATELVIGIVSRCLQLHGGYGYTWDYPVARAFADTRAMAIFGGTSEIMKLIIGRTLLA